MQSTVQYKLLMNTNCQLVVSHRSIVLRIFDVPCPMIFYQLIVYSITGNFRKHHKFHCLCVLRNAVTTPCRLLKFNVLDV